jgi:hypothetical protein
MHELQCELSTIKCVLRDSTHLTQKYQRQAWKEYVFFRAKSEPRIKVQNYIWEVSQ